MILAIHQPNLVPFLPYFRKMHLADKFCIMSHCQFEKNGYTNRFKYKDKWMTLPVCGGKESIADKRYTNGYLVGETNALLIHGLARLLSLDVNKIVYDRFTITKGTDRIIELCKFHHCNEYLTNPEAEEKYLDVGLMEKSGIKVIPFVTSKDYNISFFEAIEKWGIEGTTKMVKKPWIR